MKVSYIILGVVAILIFLVGVIFVFGDEVLKEVNSKHFLDGSSIPENIIEVSETEEVEKVEGSLDSGIGGSEDVVDGLSCKMQQIQYSLRNFENSVECTDMGVNGCIELVVRCSMEVYSFDRDISGNFGIRYALVDANGSELDFKLIEKEVEFGNSVIFSTEFVREDMFGVDDNLTCPFTVESVPRKEVCN
ncbi:MAG: hypothetical protein U9Q73_02010 [Nanoarchaeota archaeon]|nr:hypothetical protein [Nanoarchaeota archaeon]